MKLRIITSDIFYGDAIGNFSLQFRELCEAQGISCQLYARYYSAEANLDIHDFDRLFDEVQVGDIIFAQFSIYERGNERYRELPNKKIVYYHGITPPEYFKNIDPQTEENCAKGRQQYCCFKDFDYFLANSQFMLKEFVSGMSDGDASLVEDMRSRSMVVPPVLAPLQWQTIEEERIDLKLAKTNFICVGRLAPHKKIGDVIDWFHSYTKLDEDSSIVIVGSDAPPAYAQAMRDKVQLLPESVRGKIHFSGHVTQGQLKRLYQESFALLTLSEHEGFCVPVLEAMYFGLPVVARKAAAIPETLGRNEYLLEGQSLEEFASQSFNWLNDPKKRQTVLSQQNSALQSIIAQCNGQALIDLVS